MKILKSLNKKYFLILIFYLLSATKLFAEDKPVDIWNLEKRDTDTIVETNINDQNQSNSRGTSIYEMQSNKKTNSIKLDKDIVSKEIEIVGLYDPAEYGLSIDMWSNSDGSKLKNIFENINKYSLSLDASEIMNISMLTNAYYPNQNITEQEFLKFKSDWLIKNNNLDLIEEYLIKNQTVNMHPELTRYLVDTYLSNSNIKKSCEIFSNITIPIEDEYLSKFKVYCLINYGRNEEAQLILDLKKELGFQDDYYENKISFLFGYVDEVDKTISQDSILDFHLAHRTNSEFSFEPNLDTPKFIWKYLSALNLLFNIKDIEITDVDKISTIEKAVHDKNYPEKDLFEFYKKFQFNIGQFLNAQEVYKSLSPTEGRALLYQRTLLTEDLNLKLDLIKTLKDAFNKDKIGNAFDEELKRFLNQISEEDVPPNYTTFYNNNSKIVQVSDKKIKFNNKILHQSKLLNYFLKNYDHTRVAKDTNDILKKIKSDKKYIFSNKDKILLDSLEYDGIKIKKQYKNLYDKNSDIPTDLQVLVNNDDIGMLLLRLVEIIGEDNVSDLGTESLYFITTVLNQVDLDQIRNKIIINTLPHRI